MKSMITVQLPTDPAYWSCFWGSDYEEGVARANDNLEAMIRSEFADAPFEIRFERTATPGPRTRRGGRGGRLRVHRHQLDQRALIP